jgi:hypothetical protein
MSMHFEKTLRFVHARGLAALGRKSTRDFSAPINNQNPSARLPVLVQASNAGAPELANDHSNVSLDTEFAFR